MITELSNEKLQEIRAAILAYRSKNNIKDPDYIVLPPETLFGIPVLRSNELKPGEFKLRTEDER